MITITGSIQHGGIIVQDGRAIGYVEAYQIYLDGKFIAECDGYADAIRIIKKELGI